MDGGQLSELITAEITLIKDIKDLKLNWEDIQLPAGFQLTDSTVRQSSDILNS